jgi:phosphinothricin acetyltransferase
LVAVDVAGLVLGWAAVSAVSERCAYAGVVELGIYVDPDGRGRGIGRQLIDALVTSTEDAGIWTIQAGIFPENTASLALHAAAGFRTVGLRERLGRMTHGPLRGQWRDVVLVERRSQVVGA